MRRLAPRPLATVLAGVVADAEPATLLARVQSAWKAVVGAGLAASAGPVAERDGVVTVGCESAVWAHELELLGPDLVARLNEALAGANPAERTGPGALGAEAERVPSCPPNGGSTQDVSAGAASRGHEDRPAPVARLRFVVGSVPNP